MDALQLIGVSKRFGANQALAVMDFKARPRGITMIIGPSGCGKSTLLRLMIGLIQPDSGRVQLDGMVLSPANVQTIRRKMGYVIQEGGLFPHLSAGQNVTLMARYLGWPGERIQERLEELIELTRFPRDGLARYPVQLSGGQRQRVSLMRALMLEPDMLLLDEPLGSLDPMIRAELQADLRRIFRSLGKTVVMVTHDMGEAAYFGDVIVLMRAGQIVQQGTLKELLDSPADPFVTQFINAQRSPLEASRCG